MNRRLHAERIFRGTHRRRFHEVPWPDIPDGTFGPRRGSAVVVDDHLTLWGPDGYGAKVRRPKRGIATVLTPPSSL